MFIITHNFEQGCIKFPTTPPPAAPVGSLLGKNIKLGRGEGNIKDVGMNITLKKGNILILKLLERGEGALKFGEENQG